LHCAGIEWAQGDGPVVTQDDKARWSRRVTRESNALDLEEGVFTWADPVRIARSLQASAEQSKRRKAEPFRSAMSMLAFYINRAGRNLDLSQKAVLEQAKEELRRLYGRTAAARPRRLHRLPSL
jgi:hypothetical protein